MTDLTKQWKKGELPEGWYWVKKKTCEEYIDKVYFWYDTFIDGDVPLDNDKVIEVLARVPSYDEWKASYNCMLENEVLRLKNAQLKELLKECELWFTGMVGNMNDKNVGEHNRSVPIGNFEYIFKVFSQKINEVLK